MEKRDKEMPYEVIIQERNKVGKCECGSQKAHDILGVKYDSFGAILKNFG